MAAKKVICDTDVVIDYWDKAKNRHVKTRQIIEDLIGLDSVVICGITKMELLLGALNKADLQKINKGVSRFNLILVNNDINTKAFDLIQTYSLSHGLTLPDSLIAATAIVADLELFTYNIKDYKFIKNLRIYNV